MPGNVAQTTGAAGANYARALKGLAVDPEYLLKSLLGAASVFEWCRAWLGFPRRGFGWRWLGLALLVLLVADYWLRIPGAAYALGLVWCTFAGLPEYALARRQQALHAGRFSHAWRWARLFAWLHPFDEPRATARWIHARALAAAGRVNDAERILQALERHPTLGELGRLEGLLLAARWSALVARLEERKFEHPGVASIALQAFGETGKLQQMLAAYRTLQRDAEAPGLVHLEVAAYLGSVAVFEAALERVPAQPAETIAYFRGVALQASGERPSARALLQEAEAHPAFERRALARLRVPLEPVSALEPQLQGRAQAAEQALQFTLSELSVRPRRPWVTWSLGLLLVAMFLRTVPGGSLDAANLIDKGALVLPQDIAPGAWRILTTGFLHRGATHLGFDLLLLFLLGSALERLWGWSTLLACFLCANIGSYAIAAWLTTATADRPELALGASAGAFGIVGALITFDAVGYAFERSRILLRRMSVLGLFVAGQTVFDAFTPIMASSLHWTGALLGALVASPLAFRFWRRHAPSAKSRA